MHKSLVSVVRYESPIKSVRKAVELSNGLENLPARAKVFIKPNIVFWTKATIFPKWGVITTSRVIEDMVLILKEYGVEDITIGEGTVMQDPKDRETPVHAFESLGYGILKKRYGVKAINIMERPFEKLDLGDGVVLNFNQDILHSDFVVDLPVMKSHNQTVVSLGIKNLKGMIDIPSRKKCHSADPKKDLHYMVARLADKMPPMFTLLDGIYTAERGPAFDGYMRRSNILVGSRDVLAADLVGAKILGYEPTQVPHLAHAAKNHKRPLDFSDIQVLGEPIEKIASLHEHSFAYTKNDTCELPVALAKMGLTGIYYRKYDLSMCTYCSNVNGLILTAIRAAWKGEPWDKVEILTGKMMKPTPGMKKTILLGKCMYQANKDNPDIQQMLAVKGCPPKIDDIIDVLQEAGIEVDPALFENIDKKPGFFMKRYKNRPEFEESFFQIT